MREGLREGDGLVGTVEGARCVRRTGGRVCDE